MNVVRVALIPSAFQRVQRSSLTLLKVGLAAVRGLVHTNIGKSFRRRRSVALWVLAGCVLVVVCPVWFGFAGCL